MKIKMEGVREYNEELPVYLIETNGRPVIEASNEAGCNITQVDLIDLLRWLVSAHPSIISESLND